MLEPELPASRAPRERDSFALTEPTESTEPTEPSEPTEPANDAGDSVDDPVGDLTDGSMDDTEDVPGQNRAIRVAQWIERDIALGGWRAGSSLGTEAELRERYRVSRAVMREAIRLVEHHEVAVMRRGASGGLIVRAPGARAAASAVLVYLDFAGTTLEHVLSARQMVEPLAAMLAAERITESGIRWLRNLLDVETAGDDGWGSGQPSKLALTIAELSGNPALRLLVDVLSRLTRRFARARFADPAGSGVGFVEAHLILRELAHAVATGQSAKAQLLAVEHVAALRSAFGGRAGQMTATVRPSPERPLPQSGDQKLAEVVAEQLFTEVSDGGWRVGSLLGSEAGLRRRFQVSRAVFREAVRLLEYHRIAKMRRGPGGGLFVTAPDASASIRAVALHLAFQGVGDEDLWTVREALELSSLDHVVERVHAGAGVHSKPFGLCRASWGASRGRRADPEEFGQLCDPWHVRFAELTGNPVLPLFLRVLTALAARRVHGDRPSAPERSADGARADIEDAHRGIMDALRARDAGLARYRMRRHLRTLAPSG